MSGRVVVRIVEQGSAPSERIQPIRIMRRVSVSDGVEIDTGRAWMSGYQTVVVGTDGSDSSLRAVERAAEIAARSGAKLVVATAYFPHSEDQRAADVLKD